MLKHFFFSKTNKNSLLIAFKQMPNSWNKFVDECVHVPPYTTGTRPNNWKYNLQKT